MRLTAPTAAAAAKAPTLPLPQPLINAGLRLREGQLSLTVAGPGVGKSMFWLNLAYYTGLPTLYWSADTDQHDVLARTQAYWSGLGAAEIERNSNDPQWVRWLSDAIQPAKNVEWVFEPTITAEGFNLRRKAFAEVHGMWPRLIVVDNLRNVVQDQTQERQDQLAFMLAAQKLARDTRAHVAVLAHAEGQYDNGTKPIPLTGVLNKTTKEPEVVLTLFHADEAGTELGLVIAKQRGGKADPAAHSPIRLKAGFETATVQGFRRSAA